MILLAGLGVCRYAWAVMLELGKVRVRHNTINMSSAAGVVFCCCVLGFGVVAAQASRQSQDSISPSSTRIESALIVTQFPAHHSIAIKRQENADNWLLWADRWDGARLVRVHPDSSIAVLSVGFHSASDPEISFDASHILFAGKRTADDDWNIYEMAADGSNVRLHPG